MKNKILHNISIIIVCLLVACAQPATPTGGDKDTEPPTLLKTSTPNYQTLTKPNKITFYFNENIQVKNPKSEIIISPYISKKTEVKNTNRTIDILLENDSLLDNTTYSIFLNQSISDLNENNVGTYLPLLFSTGNKIDSQTIQVKILTIDKPKKENYYLLSNNFLYPEIKYITATKKNTATFYGLKQTPHQIVAFNDENGNNTLDSTESYGYHIVDTISNDTVPIVIYSQRKATLNLFKTNDMFYAVGIDPFSLEDQNPSNLFYLKDTIFSDSITIQNVIKFLQDQRYIIPNAFENKKQYFSYHVNINDTANKNVNIQFNNPIISCVKDSFIVINKKGDTLKTTDFTLSIYKNEVNITTALEFQKIIIRKNSIMSSSGGNSSSIIINSSNNCTIAFRNILTTPLIGKISNTNTVIDIKIDGNGEFTAIVPCGTYEAYFFEDKDKNYYITPPNIKKKLKGEQIIFVHKIETSNKLTNEIVIKPSE